MGAAARPGCLAGGIVVVAMVVACGSDDGAKGSPLMPGSGGVAGGGATDGGGVDPGAGGAAPATGGDGGTDGDPDGAGGASTAPEPPSNLGTYEGYSTSCDAQVCESDEQCVDGPRGTLCVHPCAGHPCKNDGEVAHCTREGGVVCL